MVNTALGPSLSEQLSPNDHWGRGVAFCRWRLRQEADPSPLRGQLAHLSTSRWVSWGYRWPRGQAGGCALEGSRALAKATHWLGPGLEVAVTFFPTPSLWLNGSSHLHRSQTVGPSTPYPNFNGPRSLRAGWALGALLPQRGWLSEIWGPGPEGATRRSVSSARPGTGWKDPAWVLGERFGVG